MAEYVSSRTEEWVPMAEELQRSNILNLMETRELLDNISQFEYKIQSRERKLNDILEYVGYQRKVLKIIKKRRKKMNFDHKRQEIEGKLISRIHSQFGSAKIAFSHDLQLWKSNVEFLQKLKSWSGISALYVELLRLHGSKYPHLFKNAIDFEYNQNPSKGIETARHHYKLGFRMHPKDMSLIIHAFSLELKYIDYLYKNKNELETVLAQDNGEELVINLKLAKLLYKQSTRKATEVNIFLDFFFATQPYDFAATFREEIIEDIKERCGDEFTFDQLAKLAINNNDVGRAIQQYRLGIEVKPTEKMYDYFLESLWLLICKVSNKYIEVALPVCQQAHENRKMSVHGYVLWSQIQAINSSDNKNHKNAKAVLQLGIQRFESDHKRELWILNMEMIKLKLKEDFNAHEVQDRIFSLRSSKIPEDFWTQSFLAFVMKGLKNSNLESFVETVSNDDVKAKLRTTLLNHIACQSGRSEARTYYKKYQGCRPLTFSFHQTMIKLELLLQDRKSSIGFVRQCYQNAIYQFGSSVPEVWTDIMGFENNIAGDPQKASYYHSRALTELKNENLRQRFIIDTKRN